MADAHSLDVFGKFADQVRWLLLDCGVVPEAIQLVRPPRKELGDLSTSAAFVLAARSNESPRQVAQRILACLNTKSAGLVERATMAGAGYINFYINYKCFAPQVLAAIQTAGNDYGAGQSQTMGKVVIEHTSVNPNKPWHIGHARNAILGDALGRLYRKAGYNVEIQNYIDDTGKQVADTIFALDYFRASALAGAKFDHLVGEEYVRLHRLLDEQADTPDDQASQIQAGIERVMHELEEGVHRGFVERCVNAQLETAWRLGIFYDRLIWESDIIHARLLEEAMSRIRASEYVHVADEGYEKGCLVIEMGDLLGQSGGESDAHHLDKILIRSTGVPTYTAKDIAFQMWKFGLLQNDMQYAVHVAQPNGRLLHTTHPDGVRSSLVPAEAVINVIGVEQEYPQAVVRAALKILGYEREYENSHHLAYGHAWLEEGRMSGRKGIGVSTDDVIEATVAQARRVVQEKRGDELGEDELARIAQTVGIGAVRFAMLRKSPETQVNFRLDEVVNFSGYTALYLQYVYVRISSLLAKAQERSVETGPGEADLDTEDEKALILQLALLPSVVRDAVGQQNPSLVCQYGYDVAQAFNQFYKTSPVLNAPEGLRAGRLRLVVCTGIVLRVVMELLGIPLLEQM